MDSPAKPSLLDQPDRDLQDRYVELLSCENADNTRPPTPEGELMDSSACCVLGQPLQPLADEHLKEVFLQDGRDPMMWSCRPPSPPPPPPKRRRIESFFSDSDSDSEEECNPEMNVMDIVKLPNYFSPAEIRAYSLGFINISSALTHHCDYCQDCSGGMSNGAAAGLPVTADVPNPSSSGSIRKRKKRAAKATSGRAKASSGRAKASSALTKASSALTKAASAPTKAASAPTKASMNSRSLPRGKGRLNVKSVTAKGSSTKSSKGNGGQKGKEEDIDEGAENHYKKERKRQKAEKERERRGNSKQLLEEAKSMFHAVFPLALGQKTPQQKFLDTFLAAVSNVDSIRNSTPLLQQRLKEHFLRRQKNRLMGAT